MLSSLRAWVRSGSKIGVRPALMLLGFLPLLASCGLSSRSPELPERVEFNRDIRPILSNKCYACHGPDARARKAGLRLDLREAALAEREGWDQPAIVPGSAGGSALVERITHSDPEKRMPPPQKDEFGSGGEELTEREVALLTEWIDQGAEYQPHWSFIPPRRSELPVVKAHASFERNPVDRFILEGHQKAGLEPAPEADPNTLFRRLNLDLTGLPPTPEELEAFLADSSPEAYEKAVDRLLDSPHYGEKMALWWLDLVRYADTIGYHSDVNRHIWPYRDYVIDSFNRDKPFDEFTREQLAGDLLPEPNRDQLVATGFNRLGQVTAEGGSQPKEYLAKYSADWVRTVSTAWMGATMACAECHDHKFDPFTQKDFYSLAAFYSDVKQRGVYRNEAWFPPERPLPPGGAPPELVRRYEALQEEVRELKLERSKGDKQQARYEQSQRQLDELADRLHVTLVTESIEPKLVRILPRGNWQDDSGEIVQPDVPAVLPALGVQGRRPTRLDLADWLVSPDNPLTARVLVNHLWREFFGRGIVRTVEDFGSQGEWPTHPELLDWLALELMERKWAVKPIVRLIVTSGAYRQSSGVSAEKRRADPENRFWSRQARFRLSAELVRDHALSVSGLLSDQVGGPSSKPYQPEDYWKDINTFGQAGLATAWQPSAGKDQYRRGLYTYWKRTFPHPSLVAFDAPTRQECIGQRTISNTPLQSLVMLNDPSYVEAARVWAARLLKEPDSSFEERVQSIFMRAVARPATAEETAELKALYERQLERYRGRDEDAALLLAVGQYPFPEECDPLEAAAWTAVTRAVLNLHEMITRY